MTIQHTVNFRLVHEADSEEEKAFLQIARDALTRIECVKNFEIKRQISTKSAFRFCFSMEFLDAESYQAYNRHPAHVDFVATRWLVEVADFQEYDFTCLKG